ncbi:hypothetical protein SNE40_004682 [Patella caerulea]|uniref:DNA-directed DNA polymerase n=2 Tax=Patella caerulea TaxID=87958 RepID=A0AAN8K3F2_PATCE
MIEITRCYENNDMPIESEDYDIHLETVRDDHTDVPEADIFAQLPKKDLFSGYINMFLKIKQECSGYPSDLNPSCTSCDNLDTCCHIDWVSLEQKRTEYIKAYKQHENITLEANKISKNPGLRYVAKQCLVNLWGKFAENTLERVQTVVLHDPTIFCDYLYDGTKNVKYIEILNDETVLVQYTDRQCLVTSAPHVNVAIGAFTAAYGSLKVYEYLDRLNDRVLYFDTDSIIFTETNR